MASGSLVSTWSKGDLMIIPVQNQRTACKAKLIDRDGP